ncbi:hypothetical protein MXB_1567 [Myxobolus squamalis]|nr:hypothetical protein MXB_1567 [Myxobolus squamalis]
MGSTFSQHKNSSFTNINCLDENIEFNDEIDSENSNNQAQLLLDGQEFYNTNPGPFEELQKMYPLTQLKVSSLFPIYR